jgi:UDP-N-acetyl-D-glucosamine dehydrogenase
MKVIFTEMGIDIWEVIAAASTKPFGFMPFFPGPGLGGHCIPIDPFYLTWKAREHGVHTRFIELAGEINTAMPAYVINRLALALDCQSSKGLNGSAILLVGMSYKKNINDTRESPALEIMDLLEQRGARVSYHDPLVPVIPETRRHPRLSGRHSVELTASVIEAQDAVLIVTDHDAVAYHDLVAAAPLVVDTRNATRHVRQNRRNVVHA